MPPQLLVNRELMDEQLTLLTEVPVLDTDEIVSVYDYGRNSRPPEETMMLL